MRKLLKKILPFWLQKKIRPTAHGFLALLAALRYFFPARQLVVIGVTGTAGKSTTIQMLAHILNSSGNKCGYITTVGYFDGKQEHLNTHGLSMPSGPVIQRALSEMLDNKCKFAIIEVTSEGLQQNRHLGIGFDATIFTNLSAAHIEAHGSFKQYKRAKGKLFQNTKIIGVNLDDENSDYFLAFKAQGKFGVTFMTDQSLAMQIAMRHMVSNIYMGEALQSDNHQSSFTLKGQQFKVLLPGEFNAYNALLAVATANVFGVSLKDAAVALQAFTEISGRMQEIKNNIGIQIFLDYAPEPIGMQNALETVTHMPPEQGIHRGRVIHVFGATGGHRDVAKRFEFGEISAHYADVIIITNDDVYDSDPETIAKDIFAGIERAKEKKVKDILTILDRKQAIRKALEIAEPRDTVLITGKGSEQFLVLPGNNRIAWDEKKVIEEILTTP